MSQGGAREDRPMGGRDYPRDRPEFRRFFPDEQACLAYLARLRWPDGFRCPACGGEDAWRTSRGHLLCTSCRRQTSVTAGTVFAGTRTPLLDWFEAVWQLVSQKQGMSALGLQRAMGLGSYETAWAHLHKLRRAMVRPGRELLEGTVEVDEGFVGGREIGMDGRQTAEKSIVVVAVEVREGSRGEFAGRARLTRVERATKDSLETFVTDAVARGSVIRTDGWNAYGGLPALGYDHRPVNVSRSGGPASVSMPHVHRVFALLKRWLLGTHQGSVQPHQLDYYLDEFTFRFNRRRSRHPGLLFYRLLQEAVRTEPIPLKAILGGHTGRRGTNRELREERLVD
ncbi:MAG TPA: IS1595 family transposase [Solirubrobacterales bacterium]|nr:IS1595 family transposase [Solirubrobacterales bacterium]